MPEISVVMGVYNAASFLAEAIESILSQTYNDFEFIIVNDRSTDESEKIIRSFTDSRIQLINLDENKGLSFALNRGIEKASGRYIARMDADDVSLPHRFDKQMNYFASHPETDVLGSAVYEIDESGNMLGVKKVPQSDERIKKLLIKSNPFFHSVIMMKRSALEESGYYDESIRQTVEDWDLWFRMSRRCKMANLDEPLLKRRFHKENMSLESNDELLLNGMKLRIKYIGEGYYSAFSYRHLLKPFAAYSMPGPLKKFIRQKILKSNIYGSK